LNEDVPTLAKRDGTFENDSGVMHYYPIMDRSNAMVSQIDPNQRDIIVQIRHALTGGNYQIAEQLLLNGWGRLSMNDKFSLIEWVEKAYDQYNQMSGVPKSGYTRLAKLKDKVEKREITKEEFTDHFLKTAIEYHKINK
jgi:hypothetical protein